jgi:hypothetical protein
MSSPTSQLPAALHKQVQAERTCTHECSCGVVPAAPHGVPFSAVFNPLSTSITATSMKLQAPQELTSTGLQGAVNTTTPFMPT